MGSTNRLIIAMVAAAVLAGVFWTQALSPKRQEASELGQEVTQVEGSLSLHRSEAAEALAARREFPVAYQQLVVLGKAVPGDDDTASLLVQLKHIADSSGVRFQNISLNTEGGEAPPPPAAAEEPSEGTAVSNPISPTEAAASTLPLGVEIGPAGLAVMPYELTFEGDFFHLADFIKGLDSLVKTSNEKVDVRGRLITIDGFSLAASATGGFPALDASVSVTTYLTPPSEGLTAGATPEAPAPATATPASTTLGGTP